MALAHGREVVFELKWYYILTVKILRTSCSNIVRFKSELLQKKY